MAAKSLSELLVTYSGRANSDLRCMSTTPYAPYARQVGRAGQAQHHQDEQREQRPDHRDPAVRRETHVPT
jgi:hypothetical protein